MNPISTPTFPDQHVSVQSPSQFPLPQPPLSSVQQPPPSSLPLPSHVSAPQDIQHSEPQPTPVSVPQPIQPPQPFGETFQQRRARLDRQEMMPIFNQPHRHQRRNQDGPYSKPTPNDDDDLANVVFQVEDVDPDGLPSDWHFRPETGYFELRPGTTNRDFWEVKAGCLIRHHVHPRKTLFDPNGFKDIPIPVEHLDKT